MVRRKVSENPWVKIPAGAGGAMSALRVDATVASDIYWVRRTNGSYGVLFQLPGCKGQEVETTPLRGIDVKWIAEKGHLLLVLDSHADWEIFATLCLDLTGAAAAGSSDASVLSAVLARLGRWQRLLAHSEPRLLSPQEIRGLFAELLFLKKLISRSGASVVHCWSGPDGAPQDFSIGTTMFEVKANLIGSAPVVRISSPEQLWCAAGAIFLIVFSLGSSEAPGDSLSAMVDEISEMLVLSPKLQQDFEEKLGAAGYLPLPAYEHHRYVSSEPVSYYVLDAFPRLVPAAVPAGVVDVSYSIQLSACEPYRLEPSWTEILGEKLHG
jgi:hypothetical protein